MFWNGRHAVKLDIAHARYKHHVTWDAYERVRGGKPMPGVIEVSDELTVGKVIQDLLLPASASHEGEWEGQVICLPLR